MPPSVFYSVKVSVLNISSILSSKLEDDPLYTSYASMMAKVHLVFFLSLQSSCFPLTSSAMWKPSH